MKRRFLNASKKVLALALTAVMAMPVVVANPIEAEAAASDYGNPAYLYEFNGDYTNSGSSGTATATVVGGGSIVTDSERGQVFDNCSGTAPGLRTNYVKLPDSFADELATKSAMTIGMWVKSPTTNSTLGTTAFSGGWAPAFTMTNSAADWNWFCVGLRGTTHANFAGIFDNNATNNNTYNGYLDDNGWHYLTATVTASKTNVYIDGQLFNSLTRTDAATVFSDVYDIVAIGGNQVHCWSDNDAHIYFDDVAIWFGELSAAQVASVYNGEGLGAITGITGTDMNLAIGESAEAVATYSPSTTSDFGFTLSTEDTDIVNIVGNKVIALSSGTATVTMTSTVNTNLSDTFTVTVADSEWGARTVDTISNTVYMANSTAYEKLVGDFNITYTFTNTSTTNSRWENFFLQLMDSNGKLQTYRCDAWCDSQELGAQSWESAINWGTDFATFTSNMQNADVTVNVVRQGSTIVADFAMTYADNTTDTATCTITNESLPDVLFARITSGYSTLSDIKLTSLVQTIGAQVKGNDLGFVTTISKADFEALDIKEMGVKLTSEATGVTKTLATSYVTDIANLDSTQTATDTYAFRSIIKGITDTSKEYTAVAYITYTVDGTDYTVYGPAITRSIDYVNN